MTKKAITTRKNASKKKSKMAEPRQGVMTGEEFVQAASDALGGRGWQKAFVRGTGLAPSTVTRYIQEIYPVPQHVALIVEMLATLRSNGLPVPESFSAEQMPGSSE
jgi:hypothetical protein